MTHFIDPLVQLGFFLNPNMQQVTKLKTEINKKGIEDTYPRYRAEPRHQNPRLYYFLYEPVFPCYLQKKEKKRVLEWNCSGVQKYIAGSHGSGTSIHHVHRKYPPVGGREIQTVYDDTKSDRLAMTRCSIVHGTREGFSLESIPKVRSVRTIILLGRVEGAITDSRAPKHHYSGRAAEMSLDFCHGFPGGPMEVFYDP
ncbi:hypothetical protein CDAR_40331 [Caerostris darwini]|uniref:Uncharacterized protein n=1 Tax=Caerostris darwini TaxID=1538125 RepID=A0AAV4R8W6_9ARAC|nr:hypothetical protein CDAR_40331 [Caerostris darwini]